MIQVVLPSIRRPSLWQRICEKAFLLAGEAMSITNSAQIVSFINEEEYLSNKPESFTLYYPMPFLIRQDGSILFEARAAVMHILGFDDHKACYQNSCLWGLLDKIRNKERITLTDKMLKIENPLSSCDKIFFDALTMIIKENPALVHPPNHDALPSDLCFSYDWSVKRCPIPGKRNVLITSALPYVNNVPHLGNIIGAVLSADVFARYCRARGYQTLYICGTDEYGTATETKALEEKITCQEICARYFQLHAAIYSWFQIKFDHFGRTSTVTQTAITHDIFWELYSSGYFLEQSVEQCWCDPCQRFLADRYIEGTCPHCSFPDARGDQCDGCGKLVNATELKNARCKICGQGPPRIKSSNHLFLDLTRLQGKCGEFVERASQAGQWSNNSAAIANGWLHEGLKPRCMTRDLKWGTPVPLDHMQDKVFYVWFDAPIGYLSITADYFGEPGPSKDNHSYAWEQWWKSGSKEGVESVTSVNDVQLYQFMGKDNVPFHTVIFPSTLLGCQKTPYTLLHHINTTEYLTYEGGKFSKSRKLGVFGNDAMTSGIAPSLWRYYLLATRPESTDAAFTWSDFAKKCNGELLANLGNFVARVTKFVDKKFDGRLSGVDLTSEKLSGIDLELVQEVNKELAVYHVAMSSVKLKAGLKSVMAISSLGNLYLTNSKLDNKLAQENPSRCKGVLLLSLELIHLISAIIEPFLPGTSQDILDILELPPRVMSEGGDIAPWSPPYINPSTYQLGMPKHLFTRIEEAQVRELKARYSGVQVQN